jgi:flagellar protein FliS
MTPDANLTYRYNEALTADPVGLVVLLYDILLRDIREALAALAVSAIERRAAAVRHGMLVLQQLQSTLDMDRGGNVARNLESFYNFTRAKLLEGQIKASTAIFEEQIVFVSSIREAWLTVQAAERDVSKAPAIPNSMEVPGEVLAADTGTAAHWSA